MKSSRSELIRKILLTIDQHPSSIYDILYSMTNFSDPKRTRLPKLLKSMENDNLVVSALQPGPLGPYRRIYRRIYEPGPEAEDYLIENLRCAMETLLHFYNAYRMSVHNLDSKREEKLEFPTKDGKILFVAYPQANVNDLDEIRNLSATRDVSISIIGPDDIFCKTGISYDVAGSDIISIESPSKTFSEVHLRGIPPMELLPAAVVECKRVLCRGGVLTMVAPFVFFTDSKKATIEKFIRETATMKFPELGVVNGKEIVNLIEKNFSKHGTIETEEGEVHFWAIKS
ncbi:MAG: hypothetical protein ACTSR9_06800 [Candidatus Thorarchaeota archaeon]